MWHDQYARVAELLSKELTNDAMEGEIRVKIAEVKRGMKAAVKRALTRVIDLSEKWKRKYFPKDMGTLISHSAIDTIQWLNDKDFLAPIHASRITEEGVDVASIIADMRGVHWTGGRDADDWWNRWLDYIDEQLTIILHEELSAINIPDCTIETIG